MGGQFFKARFEVTLGDQFPGHNSPSADFWETCIRFQVSKEVLERGMLQLKLREDFFTRRSPIELPNFVSIAVDWLLGEYHLSLILQVFGDANHTDGLGQCFCVAKLGLGRI